MKDLPDYEEWVQFNNRSVQAFVDQTGQTRTFHLAWRLRPVKIPSAATLSTYETNNFTEEDLNTLEVFQIPQPGSCLKH
uniref:Uncharacterized protein n=1 Tax=Ditylenchus dipsaci TaxID=166011 RepID=A0A915CL56_9BILA